MANTIYAAFDDASLAEKAVGALLDHGARAEDISLVRNYNGEVTGMETSTTTTTYGAAPSAYDRDRTVNIDNPGGYSGGQALNDISAVDADATANTNVGYGTTYERTEVVNDPDYQANVHDDDVDDDGDKTENAAKHGISTTTGADAGSGAMKGAGVGLGLGVLAGLASLFVPGVGLVLGGGALAAALGGAAATTAAGAVAGGVTGYLKDQGVDAQIAADYDNAVKNGGALLSINVPSGDCDELRVRDVISKYGASNVNSYATRGYMA